MDIRVYDVEHGDCILILSSKNESILIDCGYNSSTGWKPSEGLLKQGFGERRKLHHLILTHPDQDHLADLTNVIEKLKPLNIWQHPQLSLNSISDLKNTLTKAQLAYIEQKKSASELQPIELTKKVSSMNVRQFYLPLGSVRDPNDLSLVTFITEDNFTACFPGDLGKIGMKHLLANKAFQYLLRETNLLIAPHHGRASAFYEPAYEYLNPKLIVLSDKESVKGRIQLNKAPYTKHAFGVKLPDGSFRRVLTTSNDGRIRIVFKDGKWEVTTSKFSK